MRVNEQKSVRERETCFGLVTGTGGKEEGREGACMYIDACNSGAAWDMAISTAPRCVPTVTFHDIYRYVIASGWFSQILCYTSCMKASTQHLSCKYSLAILSYKVYMTRSYSYESWAPDTLPDTELTLGSPGQKGQEIMAVRTRVYSTYSNESTYVGRGPPSNGANLVLQGGQRRGMACTCIQLKHTHVKIY